MRFQEVSNINKLMVLGSTVCNLNCGYCYLHDQHKNNAFVLLNKEIQKAWKDGSYVENIKKTFDAIGCKPDKVRSLEFWGGEPIIVANNLAKAAYDLVSYLPNVDSINIPTNFTRVNNVAAMIMAVEKALQDKNWDVETRREFRFHLQLSIDAPPGPMQDFGHRFSWDIYRENIDILLKELSEMPKIEKLQLCFELHATLPLTTMMEHFDSIAEIKEYLDYFNEFHKYIVGKIDQYGLNWTVTQAQNTEFPHTANPFDLDMDGAFKITKQLASLDYLQHNMEYSYYDGTHLMNANGFNMCGSPMLIPNPVCLESGLMGLTILHDGTICECPCDYILRFQPYWDWIKPNPLRQKEYREALMKEKYYINPQTASDEEKEDYDWYIYDSIRLNSSTMIHLMMNLCMELAMSGQIDSTFIHDPEKLMAHLYTYNNEYACPREQIPAVSNSYMCGIDYCRRLLNGISSMNLEMLRTDNLSEIKGKLKWNRKPLID